MVPTRTRNDLVGRSSSRLSLTRSHFRSPRKMRYTPGHVAALGFMVIGALQVTLDVPDVTAQQTRTVWDGIYTEEQAMRGDTLYARECAVCHGPDLRGFEATPALTGGEFRWRWSGLSMNDLFDRIRISMPQDDPRRVARQEKADILAFLLLRNTFPAGETDLSYRAPMLSQIQFLAMKP